MPIIGQSYDLYTFAVIFKVKSIYSLIFKANITEIALLSITI